MKRMRWIALGLLACCCVANAAPAPPVRSGDQIMQRFHAGLAQPACGNASPRWRSHYRDATAKLAEDTAALALFGYVLDAVRDAGLPSQFALIPFVESRYRIDARSIGGPAGLWQFTAATARHQGLRVRDGIDQRMSAATSTRAAVRHLARLHRMFGRDWQRTAVAYNAGEGALKASQRAGGTGLSGITRSYPRKLHAIACLLEARRDDSRWQRAMQRQVPRLTSRSLPPGTRSLGDWSRRQGLDSALVAALNPGWTSGHREVLAPVAGPRPAGPNGRRKAN